MLIWALTAPFDPARSLLHRYTCWWAQLYLRCLPGCRIHVEGREKIAPHTPYVLVANHQSAADIMALSARNQLPGVIEEIQLGGVMAHIAVRVGEHIIESVITRRSAEELKLKKGDKVTVVIKSTEVMLQKD